MNTDSVGKSERLAKEGFHPAVISPGTLNTAHSSSEIYNTDPLKSTFPFSDSTEDRLSVRMPQLFTAR